MRLTKLSAFVVCLTMVATALVDVGLASATDTNVTKCRFSESLCEPKNVFKPPVGGDLVLLENSTLVTFGGSLKEECKTSKRVSKTSEEMGNPLKGQVESMTFTGCSPCEKVTAVGLPYNADMTMASEEVGSDFTQSTSLSVTLTGCAMGIECKFGSKEIQLLVENAESGEPVTAAQEEKLTKEAGSVLCGTASQWSSSLIAGRVDLRNVFGKNEGEHKFWWSLLP